MFQSFNSGSLELALLCSQIESATSLFPNFISVRYDTIGVLLYTWKVPLICYYTSKLWKKNPVVSYQRCCFTYGMSAIHKSLMHSRVHIAEFVTDVTNSSSGTTYYIRKRICKAELKSGILHIHRDFWRKDKFFKLLRSWINLVKIHWNFSQCKIHWKFARNFRLLTNAFTEKWFISGTLYHNFRRKTVAVSCLVLFFSVPQSNLVLFRVQHRGAAFNGVFL